jgi:hypothetical protein
MLRFIIGLSLLSSCSFGVIKSGGDKAYVYDVSHNYGRGELNNLAPQLVTTSKRDPKKGKLDDLFSKEQAPIQRIGVLVFESEIQPTRSGLANEDQIFLSAQGKQLLTEKLLSVWEQGFSILGDGVEYVKVSKIKKSQLFKKYGFEVEDHIKANRDALAPDDIFFLAKGKKTAIPTVLNPRGMRDLSLALVPAYDLMAGPKFSEHAKHALNEVAQEMNLDAMLIVMSRINWTASRIDKHSGESIPEEVLIRVEASTLIPLSQYHARLNKLNVTRDQPNTTIAFRAYETKLKIPVRISVPVEQQNFEYIEKELLNPTLKTYNDLSQMLQMRIMEDIKKTHK